MTCDHPLGIDTRQLLEFVFAQLEERREAAAVDIELAIHPIQFQ